MSKRYHLRKLLPRTRLSNKVHIQMYHTVRSERVEKIQDAPETQWNWVSNYTLPVLLCNLSNSKATHFYSKIFT